MLRHPAVPLLALLLCICGQSAAAAPRSEEIENDLYTLEYSYPAAAGAITAVSALLDADLEKRKAELTQMAAESREDAKAGGFEYRRYGLWVAWSVVTDLPGWLSLSAEVSDYYGGAHPNHGFDALLWDKQAAKAREMSDLFVSQKAFADAVRGDFCAALDKARRERREGYDMEPGLFDDCVDPLDATIILGSSTRKAFNRIGFLVPPYIAGPYAEGAYEVTLPVTSRIVALVKPEFRGSFAAMK